MKHNSDYEFPETVSKAIDETPCPYCANPEESRLPVTKEILEDFECPTPGCTCPIVAYAQQCHPDAGMRAFYCKVHGTLALFCEECGDLGAVLAISGVN